MQNFLRPIGEENLISIQDMVDTSNQYIYVYWDQAEIYLPGGDVVSLPVGYYKVVKLGDSIQDYVIAKVFVEVLVQYGDSTVLVSQLVDSVIYVDDKCLLVYKV